MRNRLILPVLALALAACSQAPDGKVWQNGKYSAMGLNFEEPIVAVVQIRGHKIASISVTDGGRTYDQYKSAYKTVADRIIEAQSTDVDGVSGATYSSNAVREAVNNALDQALGKQPVAQSGAIAFMPGTYIGTGRGYGGMVQASVTFSDSSVTGVTVTEHHETAHIGDIALVPMSLPHEIVKANGTGVDGVSGATFSSYAIKAAVNDAARQAGVSNLSAFMTNRVDYPVPEPWVNEWDVVVIGAGGAGLCAGAQAAQDGNTVLVIEKNAEMGGNTLVSGGIYQATDHRLVWNMEKPTSTKAVGFDGKVHDREHAAIGCVNELKTILGWSEEPFDEEYYRTNEFVAGDIVELSRHGVHQEFLPTLRELKKEISAYLEYAGPRLADGVPEDRLILFSTTNLHIFQTYVGGLRQSADKSEWIYGDYELIRQIVQEGEKLKPWLMNMGVVFNERQTSLPGGMWYRGNTMTGWEGQLNGSKTGFVPGNYGSYIMAPYSVIMNGDLQNTVMLKTTAEELIFENGRVCGVKATRTDGTKVTARARKGVIIATGGYAANIQKVLKTNKYWSRQYLSPAIGTTNRSSMRGDGIEMAQAVGAATVGMGYTQLMPISYVADGSIAFGGLESAVFISPASGKRFIDECSERDVLSLAAFRDGIDMGNVRGAYLSIYHGLGADYAAMGDFSGDTPGKEWGRKGSQLGGLLEEIGLDADAGKIMQTIIDYDMAVMDGREPEDAGKRFPGLIGNAARNADGSYDKGSYDFDGADIRVRLLAPATHHTMGGLKVDLDRHVLDENGNIIPGLYAAGEVTGGFFGGNRLGGNALTEVMASGRIAAKSVQKDNY